MTDTDVEGRIALITGGASGIGAATARRILAGGGRVAIFDLDPGRVAATADELGNGTIGIAGDVTSTSGESAETLTVSDSAPTSSGKLERRGLAHFEFHVTAQELLEALQLGTELVSPRHDAADDEGAIRAGDGLAEHAGVLIPHGHRHTRQHRPLRVEHPATDLGRTLLRKRRGDAEQQGEHPRTGLPDHLSSRFHPN